MHGFQLWANLPASLKMTAPRYQDVAAREIPTVDDDDGTHVRVVCGEFWGRRGPVEGAADPQYLGLWVPPNHRKTLPVEVARHAFAYVFEGSGTFRDASGPRPVKVDDTGDVDNAVYNDAPAVRHPRCAMRGRRLGIRARQLRSYLLRMIRKLIAAVVVLVVLVAVAVVLIARGAIGNDTLRRALEAQLSASLHQPVTIGRLGASFFPRVALDLHDVTIGQPSGATIAELSIVTGLRGLLSKRVEDAEVIVSNSRIPLRVALAIVGAAASAPPSAPGAGLTIVSVRTLSFRHVEVVSSPYTLLIDLESALAGDRLDVSRLAAQSADTRIEMRGALSSLTRRLGKFTATASQLNLDELLAVASAVTSQAGAVAASETSTPAAAASPIDITIELTAPGGLLRGYTFQGLSASLRITPEELLLQPLKFGLFGGTYDGRLAVMTQGAAPEAKLTGQLSGMGVERILRETRGSASLSGTLSGSVALTTHGDSSGSMLAAAHGNGRVTISNGVVPGLEMVRAVVLAFGKPTGGPPAGSGSAFTRIDGTFTLVDRTLRSQDLSFNSRDFDMTGTPVVKLPDGTIDMHATVMLSRELTAQAGTDLRRYTVQDGRIVLPARITGTVAAPSVTIDMAAALQRALQNEIKRRIQGLFDKIIK